MSRFAVGSAVLGASMHPSNFGYFVLLSPVFCLG